MQPMSYKSLKIVHDQQLKEIMQRNTLADPKEPRGPRMRLAFTGLIARLTARKQPASYVPCEHVCSGPLPAYQSGQLAESC